jgi:hypothetical protein
MTNKYHTNNFPSIQETPSHLLADGTLVYLPPPTAKEKSFSFAECVARHRLLEESWDDVDKDDQEAAAVAAEDKDYHYYEKNDVSAAIGNKNDNGHPNEKKKEQRNDMMIHPLVMASARLQTNGISELTKVINLSSLVEAGEYMGYSHVMNALDAGVIGNLGVGGASGSGTNTTTTTTINSNNNNAVIPSTSDPGGGGVGMSSTASTTGTSGGSVEVASKTGPFQSTHVTNAATAGTTLVNANPVLSTMDAHLLREEDGQECNLRAQHVLDHKRKQYESATCTFQNHRKRLRVITAVQKVLDRRYLELRQRWKLSAPKHASVVLAPLRPDETIAIDVDVYNNSFKDNAQQHHHPKQGSGSDRSTCSNNIAQMVPRYAAIELSNKFHVQQVLSILKGTFFKRDNESCLNSGEKMSWTMAKPLNPSGSFAFANRFLDDLSHVKKKRTRQNGPKQTLQQQQEQQQQQQQQQQKELEGRRKKKKMMMMILLLECLNSRCFLKLRNQ